LDSAELVNAIIQTTAKSLEISTSAKKLARERFNLAEMRRRFWNPTE
jgi:hypothetical protein